ncbi:MAG: ABC transporter permease [Candidatus Omnitrophica bacterium]|nr:ABC transporter permease [Candidatus Omnitrophota bacterium]
MKDMAAIIFRRLVTAIPFLFFLSMITFFLMHLVPGNYFDMLRMNPQISEATIKQYEKLYHLDQPLIVQYVMWLKNLFHLDFGYSFAYRRPVLEILSSRLLNTLLLTVSAFLLSWILAVVTGLLAGLRSGRTFDRVFKVIAYFGLSIPNFFLCLILLYAASRAGGLPLGGMKSADYDSLSLPAKCWDLMRHMAIPVFVLSLSSFAYLFRLMRAQTLEIKDKEFVLFLRASGISESKIIFKHIARNAINPLISLFGMELPALFSGAALVEIFTQWPGLGQIMLQAVRTQDLFLVLGNMVIIGVLLIMGNLLADVLLMMSDPRIRLEGVRE